MVKVVSRYCDSCGVKIPAGEIEDGTALKYEDAYYCGECKEEVLPLIGAAPKPAPRSRKRSRSGAGDKGERPSRSPGKKKLKRPSADGADGKVRRVKKRSPGGSGEKAGASDKERRRAKRSPSAEARGKRPKTGKGAAVRGGRAPVKARRPALSDSGSRDEELSGGVARKLPMPLLIGGGVAVLLILVVIIVFATRGDGEPQGPPVEETAKLDRESLEKRSQDRYNTTLASLGESPADMTKAIAEWEAVQESLEPTEQALAQEKIADLRAQRDIAAQKAKDELLARIEGLEATRNYRAALELVGTYPAQFQPTAAYRELVDRAKKIEDAAMAEREVAPLLAKAEEYANQSDFRAAVGVLEAFDRFHYADTPWASLVNEKLKEYAQAESESEHAITIAMAEQREKERQERIRREKEKQRREEDARLAKMPWEPWFGDDLFTFKYPEPAPGDAWRMVDRVLIGKSGGAIGNGIGAITGVGQSRWKDYVFKVQYKVVKGGFKLGVRTSKQGGFVMCSVETRSDGQWHEITLSVRGMDPDAIQEIVGTSARPVKYDSLTDSEQGGISFVLDPHSEVHFKDLDVKVLNFGE